MTGIGFWHLVAALYAALAIVVSDIAIGRALRRKP